ncbi:hypothetical protein D1007_02524 [Hordeum vulgare]|nr:hypothetical protein D1007_02524 [Hordeum vulgare]
MPAATAPESNWPQSLDKPLTQELFNFGILVPPGCRLAKPWRIFKEGYPTLTNPAAPEQLRVHPDGRYNTHGRHAFWDGKNYNDVIRRCRQAAAVARASRVAVGRRSPTHLRRPRWRPRLSQRSTRCRRSSSSSARTATPTTRRGY